MKSIKALVDNLLTPSSLLSAIWAVMISINVCMVLLRTITTTRTLLVVVLCFVLVFAALYLLMQYLFIVTFPERLKKKYAALLFSILIIISAVVSFERIPHVIDGPSLIIGWIPLLNAINFSVIAISVFIPLQMKWQLKHINFRYKSIVNSIFMFFISLNPRWKNFLFIIMCVVIAYLQIGSFNGRLGAIHGDDGPIVYSYFFANPETYKNDLLYTYGFQQVFATLMNFIPAVLYKYLSISPYTITLIFTYTQFILIGLATRHFARVVTGKELIGWMAALFVFGSNIWDWNLANYGNVMFLPYAGHLVIPFILMSFSDILEEKDVRSMLWLFVGGLIHPTLVLYAVGIIGIYWLPRKINKRSILVWALLVLVAFSAVLPRFLLSSQFGGEDLLTLAELKPSFLTNNHLPPLNLNIRTKTFLLLLPLFFLSLREYKRVIPTYFRLFLSVLIGCSILVVIGWFGWKYDILWFIQLIPQRASILLVFILVPVFIKFLFNNLQKESTVNQITTAVVIFLLFWQTNIFYSLMVNNFYYVLLFLLVLMDILDGVFGPLSWKRAKNLIDEDHDKLHQNSGIAIQKVMLLIGCILLIGITVKNSWQIGSEARSSTAQAGYDIQLWARENTPEDAMIINMGRSVSMRSSVNTVPYNWFIYNRSRDCKNYIDRITEFYKPYLQQQSDFQIEMDSLDKEGVLRFASEFEADYVLRQTANPIDLEEVYRNDAYILYKIPAS